MASWMAEIATVTLIGRNCRIKHPWRCFGTWFVIFLCVIGWGAYAFLHVGHARALCG
ncbi:MAG: hypothetical protein QG602_2789 [Verrucomicrobiota bacterium]|jgi:hypothetical protein|nr:hypothetical protein [Verrucomicrobiota bacterium]